MKRHVLLYIINVLLFLFSLIVVITGIIKFPGLLYLLNVDPLVLPQAEITFLHDWIGIILTILTLVHIGLNWKWIQSMTKRLMDGKTILISFIVLFIISGLFFVFTSSNTSKDEIRISAENPSPLTDGELKEEVEGEVLGIENTQPVESNQIQIEGIGSFDFKPENISAIRDDVFRTGYFSLFDILIYLNETEQITMNYEFSEELDTHIIRDINGQENWWYIAYYDGGWPERNVWKMDLYPYKDRSTIRFFQINPDELASIYATFSEEVVRTDSDSGEIIIPEVFISGTNSTQIFEDVKVTAHNLREDYFHDGIITAIDVILSLSDMGKITHKLNWYESVGSAGVVKNYFVDAINGEESFGRCGFVYEIGEKRYSSFRGNHIHIPPDARVMNTTPEYVEFFWICI